MCLSETQKDPQSLHLFEDMILVSSVKLFWPTLISRLHPTNESAPCHSKRVHETNGRLAKIEIEMQRLHHQRPRNGG